ncbi:MAG: hypothetical protein U5L10_01560 [Candidatus Moranbacteria bacterium]|nr:hypothetical protein [Candidatus Moranbacteria bacterium]MDZ7611147.1 hypothetical protein [Candidatus Moranbacteria bacterium]MDZ7611425.1 hypothetical protein [Candidatus Moranbacteria bacterium]
MKNQKPKKPKKPEGISEENREVFTGTQVGALVEDLNDNIKLMAENLVGTNQRIDNLENRFDNFQEEMYEFRDNAMEEFDRINERFDNIESRLDNIESEIKEIKKKIDKKAGKKEVMAKIKFLEKELAELKAKVE